MLVSKFPQKDDVCLAIFQRENRILRDWFMRVSILFTRFASTTWHSERYVASRYELIKLAIVAGKTGYYNYCFSHSKKFSAVILCSESERVSIDIEPVERRLTKALEIKIRKMFPNLLLSELEIIMILECFIKLHPAVSSFELVAGLIGDGLIGIVNIGPDIFAVNFEDTRVYSRIYSFNNLLICISREKNQFPLNLQFF